MNQVTTTLKSAADSDTAPARLHHTAYVVTDHERTRAFYEDVLGFPLVAFWIEEENFKGNHLVLGHAFYELKDGSALAFFNFSNPEMQSKLYSPQLGEFHHIALLVDKETQDRIRERVKAAGLHSFEMDHGYCYSYYVNDPDGMHLEFVLEPENVAEIDSAMRSTAHSELEKWVSGDQTPNNIYRSSAH